MLSLGIEWDTDCVKLVKENNYFGLIYLSIQFEAVVMTDVKVFASTYADLSFFIDIIAMTADTSDSPAEM